MPRYYFDLVNGNGVTRDEEGQLLDSRDSVRNQAVGILPDIARDEIRYSDNIDMSIKVRDENGRQIFEAALSLKTGWSD